MTENGTGLPFYQNLNLTKAQNSFLLVGGLIILLFCFLYRTSEFRHTLRFTLQGIGLIPLFHLAVSHPNWALFSWLNRKPMVYLGAISYPAYVCHSMTFGLVAKYLEPVNSLLSLMIGFLAVLLVAVIVYEVIEKPLAAYRRKLH